MIDVQDRLYTFKAHHDFNHLQEELISDALYQALGCPVPDFAIVSEMPACLEELNIPRNGVYRLAKFIPAHEAKDELKKEKMAKHFLIDALLANWDATADHFNNVILGEKGTLYRVENGGALRCRAIEGLKEQDPEWSAHHVDELHTLRDPQINKEAAVVYGDLTQEELKDMLEKLLESKKVTTEVFMQVDENGDSALTKAASWGHADSVKLMLETKTCPVECVLRPNKQAHNVITLAAMNGHAHVLQVIQESGVCPPEFLLQHADAPIMHRDGRDHTALDWAKEEGYQEIVMMLEARMAQILKPAPQMNDTTHVPEEVKGKSMKTKLEFFGASQETESPKKKSKCSEIKSCCVAM